MTYRERAAAVPGAVLWQRDATAGASTRILPDGCLDLIWDGAHLVVAGPDTRARRHTTEAPARFHGLRLAGGLGPALLGVPAAELRDVSPSLDEVWPGATAQELAERVAAEPAAALERWLVQRRARVDVDPVGPRILELARAGLPVGSIADAVGLGLRRLHRRCLVLVGYGPQHYVRVLRLERALEAARAGASLAEAAAGSGYADQAHLSRDARDLAGATPRELLGPA